MLNYGKVHIRGLDATIQFNYQIIKQLGINFHINYSLQKAIDKTSRDSKTYLHQIPYTPLHSGAASITLATDWFNISYTLIVAGKRYTLQQNTPENTLAPYCDHSIAIFKDF